MPTPPQPQPTLTWTDKPGPATEAVEALVPAPDLGHGAADPDPNLLVHGDNLAALRALAPTHAGRVRLAYLDPPFNTGALSQHYDDEFAHEAWLSMMLPRLDALRPLLRDDGVVVSQIDKVEQAYLKVLLDEVLGRDAFVTTIAVRMSATSGYKIEHTDRTIVKNIEFLHIHATQLKLEAKLFEAADYDPHYALEMVVEGDVRRVRRLWDNPRVAAMLDAEGLVRRGSDLPALYARSAAFRAFVTEHAEAICRTHTAPGPALREHAEGRLLGSARADKGLVEERSYSGTRYYLRRTRAAVDQLIPIALKLRAVDRVGSADETRLTNIAGDWWDGFHLDMSNIDDEGGVPFKNGKKPERLLRRLLATFTRPGDLVLDPWGGSGTTAAVAQKMGRRWIAIESGEQVRTHIHARLVRVVEGRDGTGVTRATGWQGGGGFYGMRLVPGR